MKRVILILSLLIMLSACVQDFEETEPYNGFSIPGELPDIGEFSGKKQRDRFYDEYTPDFIPSKEYGKIIPYIGGYKEYTNNDESWKVTSSFPSYGFCTPDGKIVMDASSKTANIYYRETYDGFGYYTVYLNMKQRKDAPDEFYAEEQLIIPESGEWCLKLDKNEWGSQAGGGIIVICGYINGDYQNAICKFYDYNGNKINEFTGYDSFGTYSHGLMTASKWDDKEGYSAAFLNLDGEVVLGPYASVSNFQQSGTACVTDFAGNSYLIDTAGNRVTKKSYSQIYLETPFGEERIIYTARCTDGGTDILDGFGNILGHLDTDKYVSICLPQNGEIICYYNNYNGNNYTDEYIWKRLSDGSDFVSREFNVSPNQYYFYNDMYVHKADDGRAIVFDGDGETVAILDNWESISQLSPNGRYLVYTSGKYDYSSQVPEEIEQGKIHIYDTYEKMDAFVADGSGYVSFVGEDGRYAIVCATEDFTIFGGYSNYYLFDTKTNTKLFDNCQYVESQTVGGETYYSVCTDNSNTLYDEDMNVILRLYNE